VNTVSPVGALPFCEHSSELAVRPRALVSHCLPRTLSKVIEGAPVGERAFRREHITWLARRFVDGAMTIYANVETEIREGRKIVGTTEKPTAPGTLELFDQTLEFV
jgi:hypothetical protein